MRDKTTAKKGFFVPEGDTIYDTMSGILIGVTLKRGGKRGAVLYHKTRKGDLISLGHMGKDRYFHLTKYGAMAVEVALKSIAALDTSHGQNQKPNPTGTDSLIAAALKAGGQVQGQPAFRQPDVTAPLLTAKEKHELARRLTRFIGIALKAKTPKQAVRLWNWADHQPEGPGAYDEIMVAMNPQWSR